MKTGTSQLDKIGDLAEFLGPNSAMAVLKNKYIIGRLLYAISAFLRLGATSTLNISVMYSMLILVYVMMVILAFIFFRENIIVARWWWLDAF